MLSSRMVTSEQLSVFFVTEDSRRSRTNTISAFYEKYIQWIPTRRHLEACPPLRLRVHGRLPKLRCLERSVRSRQDRPVAPTAFFFFSLFHQRADDEALTRFLQSSL